MSANDKVMGVIIGGALLFMGGWHVGQSKETDVRSSYFRLVSDKCKAELEDAAQELDDISEVEMKSR